jgi:hypothetical protein
LYIFLSIHTKEIFLNVSAKIRHNNFYKPKQILNNMDYRVMVFSPEKENREKLVDVTNDFIRANFPKERFRVDYDDAFGDIRDYLNRIGGAKFIGTGKEWFGVFDQRVCSNTIKRSGKGNAKLFYDSVKTLVKMVEDMYSKLIPPVLIIPYKGEFERNRLNELEERMNQYYPQILQRWEFLKETI